MKKNMFESALNHILETYNDIVILTFSIIIVGLNNRPYSKLKKGVCSAITAILILMVGHVSAKSWIGIGIRYFWFSLSKHISIMWASEAGWSQLSKIFHIFSVQKAELIQSSSFASLLNWLASKGPIAKFIQLCLLLTCICILVLFVLAIFQSVSNLLESILRPATTKKNKSTTT